MRKASANTLPRGHRAAVTRPTPQRRTLPILASPECRGPAALAANNGVTAARNRLVTIGGATPEAPSRVVEFQLPLSQRIIAIPSPLWKNARGFVAKQLFGKRSHGLPRLD